jgi:hypothetical protein
MGDRADQGTVDCERRFDLRNGRFNQPSQRKATIAVPVSSDRLISAYDRYRPLCARPPANAVVTELVGPVGGQTLREEEVRRQIDEAKIPRHHADDLVRNEIDDHSTAENLPVASEPSLPVSVAEDRSTLDRHTRSLRPSEETVHQQGEL